MPAEVVASVRFRRPEAPYRELESRAHVGLGFDPIMIEGGPILATPMLDRIRAEPALHCGTEVERVKFLDWMVAWAIDILTLPAHWRAVQAGSAGRGHDVPRPVRVDGCGGGPDHPRGEPGPNDQVC
jgi:hypothetical protein